jgi:ribonucleoside-triphosphate reductase
MNENDSLARYLKSVIPDLVEPDTFSASGVVVSIPQESPKGAITRDMSTALDILRRANMYNQNWIALGHRSGANTHNCSVTINVRENEWEGLAEELWNTRNEYTGVSLLPYDGGTYVQAPFEECSKDKFEEMQKLVKTIDLTKVLEIEDFTNRGELVACAGGACEIQL